MCQATYSVHVVEMVRDNCITELGRNRSADFFMFDYFDLLYHTELTGNDKNYENYLGIKSPFDNFQDYKVSYKLLSLYQKEKNNNKNEDPFIPAKGEILSDTPFLGVIQITLCAENYNRKCDDIERFLCECERKILGIVEACIKASDSYGCKKQLLRSSTIGDFCLVLRTDSVEMIHHIAFVLNDTQYKKPEDISVYTYTNVGMECSVKANGSYSTLSPEFIEKHTNITFALRFSAPMQFVERLEKCIDNSLEMSAKVSRAKGLFGRYDYLVNLNIKEFAEIYPILCKKKLGSSPQNIHEGQADSSKSNLSLLIEEAAGMNINERILVNLPDLETRDSFEQINEKINMVINKNKKIFEKVFVLNTWRPYYAEEHREFQELFRYMKEMCRIFLPVGVEKDAYINWLVFCEDIEVLCNCINIEMSKYEKKVNDSSVDELKRYRCRLLKHWRANIQAINQYTRLIQNVNYQTYQSPVYEIQTQISTEKIMVAYREVMEYYMLLYAQNMEMNGNGRDCISTFIYPEMSVAKVEVSNLFAPRLNAEKLHRSICCTVPSFEYFGRLYDLLPWLFHECSHQIRVLEREPRNRFVIEFLLRNLYLYIVAHAVAKISNNGMAGVSNIWREELAESMVEVSYERLNENGTVLTNDFEGLCQNINGYVIKLFGKHTDTLLDNEQRRFGLDVKSIVYHLLQIGRSSGVIDKIIQPVEAIGQKDNALAEVQEVVCILLESHGLQLQNKLTVTLSEECLIQVEDLQWHMNVLEQKLRKIINIKQKNQFNLNEREALKKYCFSVRRLHEILNDYKIIMRTAQKDNYLQSFLEEVFSRYCKRTTKRVDSILDEDPSYLYIMRNMGLQNTNKALFCEVMKACIEEMNFSDIKKYIDFHICQYRETCADIIMVASLHLTSFGYCRQVFQTISDACIGISDERYESINYKRFRLIAAVLLNTEGAIKKEDDENIYIDGKTLITQGKSYCLNTLKCIRDILFAQKSFLTSTRKRDMLECLLGAIDEQLEEYLDHIDKQSYNFTILNFLLRDKEIPMQIVKELDKYDSIKEDLNGSLYQFRRLECFCLGLRKILTEEYVIVPKKLFEHIELIYNKSVGKKAFGCKWEEKLLESLIIPKLKVSEFYNDPEQVYSLKTYSKLENTIDFIQSYYYHNRFRTAEKVGEKWTV